MTAPETVRAGGRVDLAISLETAETAADGPHVFVLEVFGPAGKKVSCYGGNLVAENGTTTGGFLTALNDTPGRWRVRARDVASGLAAERFFVLTP